MATLRRWIVPCLAVLAFAGSPASSRAQTVQYVYDELGRLVGVVAPNGESAVYTYDAVGNLLSIARHAASAVTIVEFTPNGGLVGAGVTLYGTGFSTTPSQNTVTFNGTGATVTASTATSITTSVPAGASSGTIAVTTPLGSATSSTAFSVLTSSSAPTITGFTPSIGTSGTGLTVNGTNFDTVVLNNRLALNLTGVWASTGSPTSLQTTIPTLTGSGRVSVRTPTGIAVSTADFFVPPPPITPAEVLVTDRMAVGETRPVAIGTATKVGLVIFDGAVNQRISLKVVPGPLSLIKLYRPNLGLLASQSIGAGTVLIEPPLLSHAGTYSILVDPTGSQTGTTTLTLYNVPPDQTGALVSGTQMTLDLTPPGRNALLSFSGTTGQRRSFYMGSGPDSSFTILKPDGSTQASFGSGGSWTWIEPQTLVANGTHTFRVDPNGVASGSLGVTMYDVPADVTGPITPGGSSVPVNITAPGQNGVLSFTGAQDQRVSLHVSSGGASRTVTINKPDGTTLASGFSATAAFFIDAVKLPVGGAYSILDDPSTTNTGLRTHTLYDVVDVTGPITINGSTVPVTLDTPGERALLTFSGTASQQIRVLVTGNSIGHTTVSVLKPDDTTLVSWSSSAASFTVGPATLPISHTAYKVVVDPSNMNTGSITVALVSP